jgi:hypothetical protein
MDVPDILTLFMDVPDILTDILRKKLGIEKNKGNLRSLLLTLQ